MEEMTKDDAKEDEVCGIPFLDMKLIQKTDGAVESEWYTKPTDTGIIMNWYAIAPLRYKTNLVMGFVNRIWSSTTNYESFDRGCKRAKVVLIKNQYPKSWVEWQFGRAILKVYDRRSHPRDSLDRDGKRIVQKAENDTENRVKKLVFLQYRGIETERLAESLLDMGCVMKPIFYLKEDENYDTFIET